jgi:TRAP-type C4-dicarboxylate transport system substrate-binding protein
MKFAGETQQDERALWKQYEASAMEKAKAGGVEIIPVPDKTPYQQAVKPVWDKYGPKYSALIARIQDVK